MITHEDIEYGIRKIYGEQAGDKYYDKVNPTVKYDDIRISDAEYHHSFGVDVICDGNSKTVMYELNCDNCGKRFKSRCLKLYCSDKCEKEFVDYSADDYLYYL